MPNFELLNALAETFDDVPPAAQLHVTMAAATLAGNPALALRWGQILTEHTAPEPEPVTLPPHPFEGSNELCTFRHDHVTCARHPLASLHDISLWRELTPELRDQLIDLRSFPTTHDRTELKRLDYVSTWPDGWTYITPIGREWLKAHGLA